MGVPTPTGTPTQTYLRVTCKFNYKDGGWSERYNTTFKQSSDFNAAIALWQQILVYRTLLLPYGFNLNSATISVVGAPGLSRQIWLGGIYANNGKRSWTGRKLDSEAYFGSDPTQNANVVCNDPEVCMLVRMDTGLGPFANCWLRGIRDAWIADDLLATPEQLPAPNSVWAGNPALAVYPLGGTPVGGPGNFTVPGSYLTIAGDGSGTASVSLMNAWFSCLRDFTQIYEPIAGSNPVTYNPFNFTSNANANWFYRRISSRREGLRYHYSAGRKAAFA